MRLAGIEISCVKKNGRDYYNKKQTARAVRGNESLPDLDEWVNTRDNAKEIDGEEWLREDNLKDYLANDPYYAQRMQEQLDQPKESTALSTQTAEVVSIEPVTITAKTVTNAVEKAVKEMVDERIYIPETEIGWPRLEECGLKIGSAKGLKNHVIQKGINGGYIKHAPGGGYCCKPDDFHKALLDDPVVKIRVTRGNYKDMIEYDD